MKYLLGHLSSTGNLPTKKNMNDRRVVGTGPSCGGAWSSTGVIFHRYADPMKSFLEEPVGVVQKGRRNQGSETIYFIQC